MFFSPTCSLLGLAGWALKTDSHITFPDTFTALVPVDFFFTEKQGLQEFLNERDECG